jgi:hypothetical protein
MHMKIARFAKAALAIGSVLAVAMPLAAQAEDATTFSIESIGPKVGLGNADLKKTVLNIIQLVLGLMTLIAVVLIIYAGFIWLTAAGEEENVAKAKRIISAAIVGLIIILLAWAIVIFVARTTANVTNTGESAG